MSTFGPIHVGACCWCGSSSSSSSSSSGCGCASADQEHCNPGTVPDSFSLRDQGITACACADAIIQWLSASFSGLGSVPCLPVAPVAGGVSWTAAAVTATVGVFDDASCTVGPGSQDVPMTWAMTRTAGQWRLTLSGVLANGGGGVPLYAFDSIITDADPVDCCTPLHFDNQIAGCGWGQNPNTGAVFVVCIASGGSVDLSPCCE